MMDVVDAEGKLRGQRHERARDVQAGGAVLQGWGALLQDHAPDPGERHGVHGQRGAEGREDPRGRWKVRDADITGEWIAAREAAPEKKPSRRTMCRGEGLEGEWFGISTHPDGQKRGFLLSFKPHGDSFTGTLTSSEGQVHELKEVKVHGTKLEFSIDLGGNSGKVEESSRTASSPGSGPRGEAERGRAGSRRASDTPAPRRRRTRRSNDGAGRRARLRPLPEARVLLDQGRRHLDLLPGERCFSSRALATSFPR